MRNIFLISLISLTASALKADEEFAAIPAGEFRMGNTLGDSDLSNIPIRTITLDSFNIGRYEVTKAEWDRVVTWANVNGYDLSVGMGKANDHPVHSITWYDMVKWCNARSEMEGITPVYHVDASKSAIYRIGIVDLKNANVNWDANGYRLPTEAEWEKAARGGLDGMRFFDGNTISHELANFNNTGKEQYELGTKGYHPLFKNGSQPYTSPAGSFEANAYGLYDMAGNVWEYCWDRHGVISLEQNNPKGSESGSYRILRGGSWAQAASNCRVADGDADDPKNPYNQYGFRLVRNAISGQLPLADTDNDGLSNDEERVLGTDPNRPDTDGDQFSDYVEVYTKKTSPLVFNAAITSDLGELLLNIKKLMPRYVVTTNFSAKEYNAKGLPAGLKINKKTGVISGKASNKGSFPVRISVIKRGKKKKVIQSASGVKIITVK